MKEPYVFDLIELTIENKMLDRLKNILLELGSGFAFVENQYEKIWYAM